MPSQYIRRTLLVGACLLGVATTVKFLLNIGTAALRKPGDEPPFDSSSAAKEEGSWAFDVDIVPATFDFRGERVAVEEAWVDASIDALPFLVWFPRRRDLSRAYLCIRLDGWEALDRSQTYFTDGSEGGLTGKQWQHGPNVFVVELDARSLESAKLRLARRVAGGHREYEGPVFEATRRR
jgi:hypothetical protein